MKIQRAKLHIILHATGPLAHDVNQRPSGRKNRECVRKARRGSESTPGSSVTNTRAKKPWKSQGSDEITPSTSIKLEWSAIRSELVLQSSGASLYPNCGYFETKLTHSFDPSLFPKAKQGLTASHVCLPSGTWGGKFTASGKEESLQVLTPKQDCQAEEISTNA